MIRPLSLSVAALVLLAGSTTRADEPRKPALKDTVADVTLPLAIAESCSRSACRRSNAGSTRSAGSI